MLKDVTHVIISRLPINDFKNYIEYQNTEQNKEDFMLTRRENKEKTSGKAKGLIASLGGILCGVGIGYTVARTLQLTNSYGNPDNDVYTKSPSLSDYAPSPMPKVDRKKYINFNSETLISEDGTTIIQKNVSDK